MFLILLLSGIARGQFFGFDDSFEDNSRSREDFFRSRPRPRPRARPSNHFGRFDDSDEHFFRGNRGRNSLDISDEDFFGRTRNRFGNHHELGRNSFFGTNRNSFVKNRIPSFNRNTNFRSTSNFNRNRFNNRLKIDSVEDLFDDLFDDDLDDRLRAQNTLSRLGNNFFRNSGSSSQNRGLTSFNTRLGSNRVNTPTTRTNTRPFQTQFTNNRNALNHFSIPKHTNRLNNGFSFGTTLGNTNNRLNTNRNQFSSSSSSSSNRGFPLANTFSNRRTSTSNFNRRTPSTSNNRFTSFNNKRSPTSPLKTVRSNTLSATKRSSPLPPMPGFNWPGGNGYYVSMSTGNSKPISYFVKYDD